MILPMGSYDALRVKIDRITEGNINVYGIDTNGGTNSSWYPIPLNLIPILEETNETSYQWYSNNTNTKFTLAEVIIDSIGNPETGITFLTNSISSLDNIEINYINIFPIPTTYNVIITSESNEEVRSTLFDINGRELINFVFVNSTELDLSDLDKGIYILNLNTKEGSISKKLIIE